VKRGEVWLADVGGQLRPVVVLTRDEVIDVRANVTVSRSDRW
jgi:mRNA-degrading endonuclease toxin of MazEF toxin-antitoxin module